MYFKSAIKWKYVSKKAKQTKQNDEEWVSSAGVEPQTYGG